MTMEEYRNFFININIKPPCKDCEMRKLGCHAKCDNYISYKERCDMDKEAKLRFEEKKTRRKFGLRRTNL